MLPLVEFIGFILHSDKYLQTIIATYHLWTYAILFLIIFLETGFVVTPFLPGDSLLFAAGSFAGLGSLNLGFTVTILTLAAIFGDTCNYALGYYLGPKVFKKDQARFFKKEYLYRTNEFYAHHGKKTIVLARFIPIIRTFAPFIAGIGKMPYFEFVKFNILGALLWVGFFTIGGYYFGTIPFVQENFSLVILGIILCSIIPIGIEILRMKKEQNKQKYTHPISLK